MDINFSHSSLKMTSLISEVMWESKKGFCCKFFMTIKRFLDSPNSLAKCEKGVQSGRERIGGLFFILRAFLLGECKYLPFKFILPRKWPFYSFHCCSLHRCFIFSREKNVHKLKLNWINFGTLIQLYDIHKESQFKLNFLFKNLFIRESQSLLLTARFCLPFYNAFRFKLQKHAKGIYLVVIRCIGFGFFWERSFLTENATVKNRFPGVYILLTVIT